MKLKIEFKNGLTRIMDVYEFKYNEEGMSWEMSKNVGDHEERFNKSIPYEDVKSVSIDGEVIEYIIGEEKHMNLKDNRFFEAILQRYLDHLSEKGASWKAMEIENLEKKLEEEWEEWKKSKNPDELIDLSLVASFIWFRKNPEKEV